MQGTVSSILALAAFLAMSFAAGIVGMRFEPDIWYASIRKSELTPPGWVFGVVWPALYTLMGIAAWLAWRKGGLRRQWPALSLYAAQLLLNGAWTWLFFGLHQPGLALADIAGLWILVAGTLTAFWRATAPAGALMIPYLAWISFAAYLNFFVWRANG